MDVSIERHDCEFSQVHLKELINVIDNISTYQHSKIKESVEFFKFMIVVIEIK